MKFCWIVWYIGVTNAMLCSKTVRKGPYSFKPEPMQVNIPSRRNMTLERVRVVRDVRLAMMYRAFWSSYCYNGGPLDPNTGCVNGITKRNPTREEASDWISREKCEIGSDCTDCWGSDSKACLQPDMSPKEWVTGKELIRNENNNHFPFHTCNLSWRCGLHTASFPTFITMGSMDWEIYTEHSNGSKMNLNTRDMWDLGDTILVKTQEPEVRRDTFNASCFTNSQGGLACYDDTYSKFIEFQEDWTCQGQSCYRTGEIKTHRKHETQEIANLHAASIEDLRAIITKEHQLNEELRYNFALITAELEQLRTLVRKTIISTAKIDDRLLGNILGNQARSQFVSETAFLLTPCADPPITESNCFKDLIYRDGRWMKNTNTTDCIDVEKVERLDLVKRVEMWFPELGKEQYLGTSQDFDGWTFYAYEKENLNKVMEWVQNHQATTSLADLVEYPKQFLNHALTGFLTTHAVTIVALIAVMYTLCKGQNRARAAETRIIVNTQEENQVRERRLQRVEASNEEKLPLKEEPEEIQTVSKWEAVHYGVQLPTEIQGLHTTRGRRRDCQLTQTHSQYQGGNQAPEYEVIKPVVVSEAVRPLEHTILTLNEHDVCHKTTPPPPPHRRREKFSEISFRRRIGSTRGTSNRRIIKQTNVRMAYINHV